VVAAKAGISARQFQNFVSRVNYAIVIRNHMLMLRHIFLLTAILFVQVKLSGQTRPADTTFILRDTAGGIYHAIYIDNNKNTDYYKWLTDFSFDHYDSSSYLQSVKAIFNENPVRFKKTKITSRLPRQWCTLYSYKDKYYLYAPSDWGNNSRLMFNDSTVIEFIMEGPYACIIDSFAARDQNTFEFSVHSAYTTITTITIHIIDWENQLAIFDNHTESDDFRFSLRVGSFKANRFPVVVNYCRDQKQSEFDFDNTDYRKLLVPAK
jgi:hypothetical protein